MPCVRKVCFRLVVYYEECYAVNAIVSPVSKRLTLITTPYLLGDNIKNTCKLAND